MKKPRGGVVMLPHKVVFLCKAGKGTHLEETWQGVISFLWNFGSHYEMQIQSRSSITVLFGKTSRGYFASIPDWQAGCYLVDFKDLFWNTEQLVSIIGEIIPVLFFPFASPKCFADF